MEMSCVKKSGIPFSSSAGVARGAGLLAIFDLVRAIISSRLALREIVQHRQERHF
jgi:hypothetical protein